MRLAAGICLLVVVVSGQTWVKQSVDSCDIAFQVSLTVDRAGMPCVAYGWRVRVAPNMYRNELRYAYCDSSGWHREAVDSVYDPLWFEDVALELDSSDHPRVAFALMDTQRIRICHAERTDSGWQRVCLDSFRIVVWGERLDLSLANDGRSSIGYESYDETDEVSRLCLAAGRDDSWVVTSPWSSASQAAAWPSLAARGDELPDIAFLSTGPGGSRVDSVLWLRHDSFGWHASVVDTFYEGTPPVLAADTSGVPHVLYSNEAILYYATLVDSCWQVERTLDRPVGYTCFYDLQLNSAQFPCAGVVEGGIWRPIYAWQTAPGDWQWEYVEPYTGLVLQNISLALAPDDSPVLAYYLGVGPCSLMVACRPVGVKDETRTTRMPVRTGTIVRAALQIGNGMGNTSCTAELLDMTGRRVMDLRPGPNDIRHIAPGVYFVRRPETEDGRPGTAVRKVVIQR